MPSTNSTHMTAICHAMPPASHPPRVSQLGKLKGRLGEAL